MPSQNDAQRKALLGRRRIRCEGERSILVLLANGADACCKADIRCPIDRIGRFFLRDESCDAPLQSIVGHGNSPSLNTSNISFTYPFTRR